jgi:excinuclease ABC subunit B
MAKIIENVKIPTIIMTHNKTLTAQLYSEFRGFILNGFGNLSADIVY